MYIRDGSVLSDDCRLVLYVCVGEARIITWFLCMMQFTLNVCGTTNMCGTQHITLKINTNMGFCIALWLSK